MTMATTGYIENPYWMLLQVAFKAKHGLTKLAEEHGLTVVQFYTICTMNPKVAIPMNTISGVLLCDASNVTGIVDRLLMQGYIIRQEKPEDRRVKMITLTSRGEELRYQILGELSEFEIPAFQILSNDQLRQLSSLLAIVLQPPRTIIQ